MNRIVLLLGYLSSHWATILYRRDMLVPRKRHCSCACARTTADHAFCCYFSTMKIEEMNWGKFLELRLSDVHLLSQIVTGCIIHQSPPPRPAKGAFRFLWDLRWEARKRVDASVAMMQAKGGSDTRATSEQLTSDHVVRADQPTGGCGLTRS